MGQEENRSGLSTKKRAARDAGPAGIRSAGEAAIACRQRPGGRGGGGVCDVNRPPDRATRRPWVAPTEHLGVRGQARPGRAQEWGQL